MVWIFATVKRIDGSFLKASGQQCHTFRGTPLPAALACYRRSFTTTSCERRGSRELEGPGFDSQPGS